jgi:O-antigen/teichoic acid export membrane protein
MQFVRRYAARFESILPGAARSIGWEALLAGIGFPASLLLNRSLGAEQRGVFALATLVPTTLFVLGSCQWDRIARGMVTSRAVSSNEAWRRTLLYSLPLSLVFVPVGIAASAVYPGLPSEARLYSAIYCLNFPIYFLGGTLQTVFLAAGGLDSQYWTRLSMQVSYLALLLFLLVRGWISIPVMIALYFTTHAISLMVAMNLRSRVLAGPVETQAPPIAPLVQALPPLVAESVAAKADVWAFSLVGSLATLGQYAGLSAMMLPLGLVSNAMLSSSTARLNWKDNKAVHRYLFRATGVLGVLFLVVSISGVLLGPVLLPMLLGTSFADGEWMVPWIAIVVAVQSLSNQFHASVQLSGRTAAFLRIQTGDSVIRLALTLGAAAFFGATGIFAGLILASIIKIAWSNYVLRQVA